MLLPIKDPTEIVFGRKPFIFAFKEIISKL